jgi:hypothetical protein
VVSGFAAEPLAPLSDAAELTNDRNAHEVIAGWRATARIKADQGSTSRRSHRPRVTSGRPGISDAPRRRERVTVPPPAGHWEAEQPDAAISPPCRLASAFRLVLAGVDLLH